MSSLSRLIILCITLVSASGNEEKPFSHSDNSWYQNNIAPIVAEARRCFDIAKNKIVDGIASVNLEQDEIGNAIFYVRERIIFYEPENSSFVPKFCKQKFGSQLLRTNFTLKLNECLDEDGVNILERISKIEKSFFDDFVASIFEIDIKCLKTCPLVYITNITEREMCCNDEEKFVIRTLTDRSESVKQEIVKILQKCLDEIKKGRQCSYEIGRKYLEELDLYVESIANCERDHIEQERHYFLWKMSVID